MGIASGNIVWGGYEVLTATIGSGASVSNAINVAGLLVTNLLVPATWTTANLTLQTSDDDSTYYNVYDEYGSEQAATVATTSCDINLTHWLLGRKYLKVRSGTAATPVNQAGTRSVGVVVKYA